LPAGNVDSVKVLGHLGDVDGVQSTVGERSSLVLGVLLKETVELLSLNGRREFGLQGASLLGDFGSGVDTLGVLPSGLGPPFLNLLDFVLESLLFGLEINFAVGHCI